MKGKLISVRIQRMKYVLCDLFTTIIAIFLFNIYRYYGLNLEAANYLSLDKFIFMPKLVLEDLLVPVALLSVYWLSGFYNRPFGKSRLQELIVTFLTSLVNGLLVYFAILVNDPIYMRSTSYEMLMILVTLLFCFTYTGRYLITQKAINNFHDHHWSFNTIIIGNSRTARKKAFELSKSTSRLGYNVVGYVPIAGENDIRDDKRVFSMATLKNVIEEFNIDQFIIAPENNQDKTVLKILNELYPLNIPLKIWPDTLSYVTQGIRLQDIFGEPFVDLAAPSCSESTRNIKRVCDVVISLLAVLLLLPVYIVLAICVKKSSPGSILYKQERIGYRQKPFRIIKFRTMVTDAEAMGPALSSDEDPRITKTGRILRKYRLDELPQFFNVLIGDMSLVGPRPERRYYIDRILKEAPWYTLLQQVRPGITSWGMVKYGYASDINQMILRARYDLIYLANMSIMVDIKILIYTVKTVITGKGV